MSEHEQILGGRYRLTETLGNGGMATVYLGEDLRLGRRVAIKLLHSQFANDPAFVARFEAEARMAASLAHHNIVQVYDVGQDNGRYFIVMEYVAGRTLKETIAHDGALPVARALVIADGILAALEVAHAHGLVHRDIKAQNILLPDGGGVKVADFGIAREMASDPTKTLTAQGMVIGTAQYFSPEQAHGTPATPRSDVYSVGIILYEMLTGRLPFEGDNPLTVAMQQINAIPTPPSRLNRAISPALESVVLTAMAKSPQDRYPDAGAMRAVLHHVRSGSAQETRLAPAAPMTTTPEATAVYRAAPEQAPPPSQRSRLGGVLAALGTLVLAAIVAVAAFAIGHGGLGIRPTATPRPTATAVVIVPITPTDTATATATPAPTATPTIEQSPTTIPTATTEPEPTTSPTASGTPPSGPPGIPFIGLASIQATPGSTVTVGGTGWPDGAVVTLSADFGNSTQTLDQPTAIGGAFTSTFAVPDGTQAGIYQINAQDDQGHAASATLTVSS